MNTTKRSIRALLMTVVLASMSVGLVSAVTPTVWTPTDAQLLLYHNGCPGGGPVCDESPEFSNGLECWSIDQVRWCRPTDG